MKTRKNPEMAEIMKSILGYLDDGGFGDKYGYDYCGYVMMCLGSTIVSDLCCPARVADIFEAEIMPNIQARFAMKFVEEKRKAAKKPVKKAAKKVAKKEGKK